MRNKKLNSSESGQLLLEILIAIAVIAIIGALSGQLVYVSLRGNKSSGETNAALGLVNETFEAVRSVTTEKWQNLYNLNKGSPNFYYPQQSAGKWVLTSGTENVTINGITYNRYFMVKNVCRDSSKNVTGPTDSNGASTSTCATSGGSPDLSTQWVGVAISWPDSEGLATFEYVTRWRNKICLQTTWSTTSAAVSSCPDTVYGSKTNIDASSSLQICDGCP